jgi:hypothetical protein
LDWLNHTSGRCRRSLRAAMAGWPGNGGRLPDMANWLEEYEAGLNVAGGHETKTVVVQDMPRGRFVSMVQPTSLYRYRYRYRARHRRARTASDISTLFVDALHRAKTVCDSLHATRPHKSKSSFTDSAGLLRSTELSLARSGKLLLHGVLYDCVQAMKNTSIKSN